ncbi:unnamed protein product [Chrysoparadoxa australica]
MGVSFAEQATVLGEATHPRQKRLRTCELAPSNDHEVRSDDLSSETADNGGASSPCDGSSDSDSETPLDRAIERWIQRRKAFGSCPAGLVKGLADDLGLDLESLGPLEQHSREFLWLLLKRLLCLKHACGGSDGRMAPTRSKLHHINSLEDAVKLLAGARKVMVLTGAGISVSCGIPDFRSENGIYSMLGEYNLPSPQAMFDIHYFVTNPKPFFQFAKQLLPGSYTPSMTHNFISLLAKQGRLLRNYTQNIDGLETQAGVPKSKLHQCHGSFDTATCLQCKTQVELEHIKAEVASETIPLCKACALPGAVLKPDIVMFGEPLGDRFANLLQQDRRECDLVVVIGSSLQVAPVNYIPAWMPSDVPQLLINREVTGRPNEFDIELLGDCDAVVHKLCEMLAEQEQQEGWDLPKVSGVPPPDTSYTFEAPNTYYFVNGKPKRSATSDLYDLCDDLEAVEGEDEVADGTHQGYHTELSSSDEGELREGTVDVVVGE